MAHEAQRNTETDPSGVAYTVAPYMNLRDVWHLEEAAQDVDTPFILKECAEILAGQ